jgi:hypothetical protein
MLMMLMMMMNEVVSRDEDFQLFRVCGTGTTGTTPMGGSKFAFTIGYMSRNNIGKSSKLTKPE